MSKIIDKLDGLEEKRDVKKEDLEYIEVIEDTPANTKKSYFKILAVFIIFLIAGFIGFRFATVLFSPKEKTITAKVDLQKKELSETKKAEPLKETIKPVVFSGGKDFQKYLLAKLDKNPKDTITLNNLAIFYFEHNDLQNALKYAQKALMLEPDNSYYWNTLGIVLTELNLYEDAEKCFKKALEKNPEEGVFYYNLANLYERMDKIPLSRENYLLYLSKSDKINPKMLEIVREKLKKGV